MAKDSNRKIEAPAGATVHHMPANRVGGFGSIAAKLGAISVKSNAVRPVPTEAAPAILDGANVAYYVDGDMLILGIKISDETIAASVPATKKDGSSSKNRTVARVGGFAGEPLHVKDLRLTLWLGAPVGGTK